MDSLVSLYFSHLLFLSLYTFFKDYIYLFERERTRAGQGGAEGEGEAGSPLSRELGPGLDPRTPGPSDA